MFMNYMKIKLIIALLAAMAVIVVIPMGSFAAQDQPAANNSGNANDGQKTRVYQEFTYKDGEKPDIPEKINQFGQVLTLVSVSDPVESKTLPDSRTYTYQVSKSYTPDQLSQAPDNVKLTPVQGTGSRQVDRAETITDLSNNDVDKLPQRSIYTDTKGKGPGASVNGDLALAEVKYEVAHRDEYGMPDSYTAHVVYRGEETYTAVMYYMAEATYTNTEALGGEITFTVIATYEGDAPVADGLSEDTSGVEEPEMTGQVTGAADAEPQGSPALLSMIKFPFSLGDLSPAGAATLAAIAAVVVMLLIIGNYNKRRIRESSQA